MIFNSWMIYRQLDTATPKGNLFGWADWEGWNTVGLYKSVPTQVGSNTDFIKAATGTHTGVTGAPVRLFLRYPGYLWAQGMNNYGQIGDGTITTRSSMVQIGSESDWTDIAIGRYHCLGIRSGKLYAWGYGLDYGQLGTGSLSRYSSPVQVGAQTDWTKIWAREYFSMGIRGGKLYTWGINNNYQLGDGTNANKSSPVQIGADTDWQYIASTTASSFGVRGGKLYAWGYNVNGTLGDETTVTKSSPVQIGAATDWTFVTAGGGSVSTQFAHGIRSGVLYGWGINTVGQIGDLTRTTRSSPVQVGSATDWTYVSDGADIPCVLGLNSDKKLYGWGNNSAYNIGLGATGNKSSPVQVGSATDWISITAGDNSSFGIRQV